jgi:DNA excision repair protein ERCC-3
MYIEVYNNHAYVTDSTVDESKIVNDLFTVDVPNAKYNPAFEQGMWDGKHRFYNYEGKYFPSGLISVIEENAKLFNSLKIDYKGVNPLPINPSDITYDLAIEREPRDYQMECAKQCLIKGRGTSQVTIRGGKTEIIAMVLANLPDLNVVYYFDKRMLLYQQVDKLSKLLGQEVGYTVGGDHRDGKIMCVSIPKFSREKARNKARELFKSADVLIIDEAHHINHEGYWFEYSMESEAYYRLGFSDTPKGVSLLNDMAVRAVTGPCIYTYTTAQAIEEGYVAKPQVIMIPVERRPRSLVPKDNYMQKYKKCIVDNDNRNKAIINIAKNTNLPTFILVDRKKHGKYLSKQLNAPFIQGSTPLPKRQKIQEDFDAGRVPIVIANSKVAGEGLDIENIRVLVYTAAGKSPVKVYQGTGRALTRKREGPNEVIIIDFLDRYDYTLRRQSSQRKKLYQDKGYSVIQMYYEELLNILKE